MSSSGSENTPWMVAAGTPESKRAEPPHPHPLLSPATCRQKDPSQCGSCRWPCTWALLSGEFVPSPPPSSLGILWHSGRECQLNVARQQDRLSLFISILGLDSAQARGWQGPRKVFTALPKQVSLPPPSWPCGHGHHAGVSCGDEN